MSKHPHQSIGLVLPVVHSSLTRVALKPLWVTIASLMTLSAIAVSKPAHAFSVTYDFTVQIDSDAYETQGVFKGAIEKGSFTYDDANLTGIGSEYVSGSRGNLTLQFNFLNQIYTEQADLNYGNTSYLYDYPAAFFANGTLLGLDFLVVPSQLQPPQNAPGFRIFNNAFYVGAINNFNSGTLAGTVAYSIAATETEPPTPDDGTEPDDGAESDNGSTPIREPSDPGDNTAGVPEPSEVGGAIVAFSLLGVWAMRKAKGQKG